MKRKTHPIKRDGHDYRWTRRWFLNRNHDTFVRYVLPEWQGKPITYLELGVFEGMSMVWMLQYVLTHLDSRAVGVDPWLVTTKLDQAKMDSVMENAHWNILPWTRQFSLKYRGWKCELIRGSSAEVLRRMCGRKGKGFAGITKGSVDLCMVDGNHNALAVWDDCRLVYKLLKPGGWMMMDDVENRVKKKDHVKQGLELFLEEQPMRQVFRHNCMEAYAKE